MPVERQQLVLACRHLSPDDSLLLAANSVYSRCLSKSYLPRAKEPDSETLVLSVKLRGQINFRILDLRLPIANQEGV